MTLRCKNYHYIMYTGNNPLAKAKTTYSVFYCKQKVLFSVLYTDRSWFLKSCIQLFYYCTICSSVSQMLLTTVVLSQLAVLLYLALCYMQIFCKIVLYSVLHDKHFCPWRTVNSSLLILQDILALFYQVSSIFTGWFLLLPYSDFIQKKITVDMTSIPKNKKRGNRKKQS